VLAWLIRCDVRPVRQVLEEPAWTLWSDHETVMLRSDMMPIASTYVEHGLGVCPWFGITLGPPCAGFWPGEEGEDLVAARVSVWFANVLLLKETKSATKAETIRGDGSTMARGQAADSEIPREIADGQSVEVTDMSMDLSLFRDTSGHITSETGLGYGMSNPLMTGQGVQSAEAREVLRTPLREIRLQQQTPWRRAERHVAVVWSAVLKAEAPELAFDATGWRMRFGQPQTPLTPQQRLDMFLKGRTAGVTDTLEYIKSEAGGDMTDEQARDEMEAHILVETDRNNLMRPLQQISGSPAAQVPAPAAAGADTQDETDDQDEVDESDPGDEDAT
jgi:hypothetical protein